MSNESIRGMSRRELLSLIGAVAGSAASYRAMAAMGVAPESTYTGQPQLHGAKPGSSVLVLGAGLAGLVAAYELRKAGYAVQLLEYNARIGGRNWTLRGGDVYTELGGYTQKCEFDPGLYLNPGPWRIPYHHYAVLDYCRRFGVALEPFVQLNHNAYLHSPAAFGGQPQRYHHIATDFRGHVSELLAKVTAKGALDAPVTKEDKEKLIEALRAWGALDKDLSYVEGMLTADCRGYGREPGGGVGAAPLPSKPLDLHTILDSGLWRGMLIHNQYLFQTTMFQPVGGMDRISHAFEREIADIVKYNAKVVSLQQDDKGVTASYVDARSGGDAQQARADWCVCTIPATVLGQMSRLDVSTEKAAAIAALNYEASIKVGLQFKRRFWELDEHIYGGISYTDLPIAQIGYPNYGYQSAGKGVLLGAYTFGPNAYEFTAMTPAQRVQAAVEQGAKIHPQYKAEFENGIAVGWHRVPWILGCAGEWTEEKRAQHYDNLAAMDGRIVLAGEHVSYLPAWQEGAILSSLNAIERLHQRAVAA